MSYRCEDLLPDTTCHPSCQYWMGGGGESYRFEGLFDLVGGGSLGEGCDIDDHPARHLDNGLVFVYTVSELSVIDYNKCFKL